MKQNFLKLLANIKLYSSYWFAILSVLGVVWGAYAMYYNWKDNNKVLQSNVNKIIQVQTVQNRTDSLLLRQQADMKVQLDAIQGTTESLESSYVKRLSKDKSLTTEQFLEYMDGLSFDVKKNSSNVNPPLLYQKELTATK